MALDKDLADCIGVSLGDVDLSALDELLKAFFLTIPQIISLDFAPKIPQLPGSAIDLFIGNLDPNIPNFSFKFNGIDVNFTGGIDLGDVFLPDGLIDFIIGLLTILIGLPSLFIDTSVIPPIPKIPTPDIVTNLVLDSLALPDLAPPDLDLGLIGKIARCLAKAIVGVIFP